jgi:endonuclease/exonuclease/phosphatase family metal-dependent hydrolase
VGQHRTPASPRRRALLAVLVATALALVVGVSVQAASRIGDGPGAEPREKPTPTEATSGTASGTASASPTQRSRPQRKAKVTQAFPGRPEKKTGVRTESGLGSGLGDDAGELADKAQDLIDGPDEEPRPLSFVVSTFNVLGAGHTGPRGNKPQWADWDRRLGAQIRLLNANRVDVVGFQEFERPQFRGFVRRTNGAWGVYPALSLGPQHTRNSIAWRRDVWELADYGPLHVPYFRGKTRPIPVILLTHKETGRQVFVINTHNPTSNKRRGNNARHRAESVRRQLAKMRSLRQRAPDVPVILMGDFNERQGVYCKARRAGMHAANPGGSGPGCAPPALMGIDWIFGTPDLSFADYRRQDTGGSSDHPMIVASARTR